MGNSERRTSTLVAFVPVVNLVVMAELFWWPFSAKILSVYSVAGSRSCSSYSTVFPDTVRVTSGTKCETHICGSFTSWQTVSKPSLKQNLSVTPQHNRFEFWDNSHSFLSLEHSLTKDGSYRGWTFSVNRWEDREMFAHAVWYEWLKKCLLESWE